MQPLLVLLLLIPGYWQPIPQQAAALDESIKRGNKIYQNNCQACHMVTGQGIPGAFPPLAKSDYLMADSIRAITTITAGLSGEITVNGVTYFGEMAAINLDDQQVADVLNYIRNSWGNKGPFINVELVKQARD